MAGTFSDAMSQSERDFKALILPIFKKLWRNCDFVQTESKSDELSKALDCYSGVDIVRIDHTKKITTGIASRIQRSDKCWETFTVRCLRDNNTPTEYFKRDCALKNGDISPALTYQAYVKPAGDKLTAMAIARTSDIFDFIANGDILTRHTNAEQIGQASFYVVKWRDMLAKNFEVMRIAPTKSGYLAQWRTGRKFIEV